MNWTDICRLHTWLPMSPEGWHQHPNGGGWVRDTADVTGGYVAETAIVGGRARVEGRVLDKAEVADDARVRGIVRGHAIVNGRAVVTGEVSDFAVVCGDAWVSGRVRDNAIVRGGEVFPQAIVEGYASIEQHAVIMGCSRIMGGIVKGYAKVDSSIVRDQVTIDDAASVIKSIVKDRSVVKHDAYVTGSVLADHAIVSSNVDRSVILVPIPDRAVLYYAYIKDRRDILSIGPIGSRNDYLTLTRTTAATGCFRGTHDQLRAKLSDANRDDYESALAMAAKRWSGLEPEMTPEEIKAHLATEWLNVPA